MGRTATFPIYDELKFEGRLGATLLAWRDEGLTVDAIWLRLLNEHDVDVSRSTVDRWITRAQKQAAA